MVTKINASHKGMLKVMYAFMHGDVVLGGIMVIVISTGPKVRGFKPGRERWPFKGDKNPWHDLLRRRRKAFNGS
jgi:hypothetical protein